MNLKKYSLIGGAMLILILFVIGCYFLNNDKEVEPISYTNEITNEKIQTLDETFYVDVKGAVKKPGVYEMEKGSIINDAIKKAGGLKSNANTSNINLSKLLTSEMVIYVFTKSELTTTKQEIINSPCNCETIEINNCINKEETSINNSLININTATKDELMTISGIGESKANAIIKYREENGLFKEIIDIQNVSGLGASIYDKIKDYITV